MSERREMETTPREKLLEERQRCQEEIRRCTEYLVTLPEEILDMPVDRFLQSGVTELLVTLTCDDLRPGMLTRLLSLSVNDSVRATRDWRPHARAFLFTLANGQLLKLATNAPECKKYKVMEKVQSPKVITVCGEPDPAQYDVLEVLEDA